METKSNKITGYALLILGILMIFCGVYSSYGIFTAKNDVPKVFSNDDSGIVEFEITDDKNENVDLSEIDKSRLTDPTYLKSLETQQKGATGDLIQEQISSQLKEIIPVGFILKLLNLSSWSLFMFILIFAGSKISILGIKLLKD